MPNQAFTQLYFEFIFAVKFREALIPSEYREELHKYITGICRNQDHKMHDVFAMPDHVHLLVGYNPEIAVPDFMREVKTASSKFINKKEWTRHHFNWQSGYCALSYAKSDLDEVRARIRNQEELHKHVTFLEEYRGLLNEFGIVYDENTSLKT